jgi:hypothetical protein
MNIVSLCDLSFLFDRMMRKEMMMKSGKVSRHMFWSCTLHILEYCKIY